MKGISKERWEAGKPVAGRRARRGSRAFRPVLGFERVEERTMLSVTLISLNAAGTASGNDASAFSDSGATLPSSTPGQAAPTLSADGSLMVFQSDATNLVAGVNDTNGMTDVFVRNLQTGRTQLVSATPDRVPGNGRSFDPIISPDGRYVAFLSSATDLSSVTANVPGNSAPPPNFLYIRDLETQTTTLLEVTPAGQAANGFATGSFVFSPNSRALSFVDTSTDLTAVAIGDTQASGNVAGSPAATIGNVYVRNLAAGTTSTVSMTPGGTLSQQGQSSSTAASGLVFSPDGSKLAFTSTATDLTSNPLGTTPPSAPGDTGPGANLYVCDLTTGATTLVSATPNGDFSDGDSNTPVFSPDSTRLAFRSTSTNLTAQAPGAGTSAGISSSQEQPVYDLFVRSLTSGTTTAVSVNPGTDTLSTGDVEQMVFSPDGQSLAFVSTGADLTPNPVDPASPSPTAQSDGSSVFAANVFLSNLSAGTVTAVSLTPQGNLSNGAAYNLAFSPDGQSVAYVSSAIDLTANPASASGSASTSTTTSAGSATNATGAPAIPITNLFVTNLASKQTTLVTATPTSTAGDGVVLAFAYSPDGAQLAFSDTADDLTANAAPAPSQTVTIQNVVPGLGSDNFFVRDLAAQSTTLVSATPAGTLAQDPSFNQPPTLFYGPSGQTLYFSTGAAILDTDTNGVSDIYAAAMTSGTGSPPGDAHPSSPSVVPSQGATQGGSTTPAPTAASTTQTSSAGGTATGTATSATSASQGQSVPAAAVHAAGPTVAGVTVQAARGKITGLVITFNEPVASGSAFAAGNYLVHTLVLGRLKHGVRAATAGKAIGISSVQFIPNTQTVTLRFSSRLAANQKLQLRVRGGLGGITDRSGTALYSASPGSPGSDYVATLE
jgi:hypothetical protein